MCKCLHWIHNSRYCMIENLFIFSFVFIVRKYILYMNLGILSWSYFLCRSYLTIWTSNWIRIMFPDRYHALNSADTHSCFHMVKVETSHNLKPQIGLESGKSFFKSIIPLFWFWKHSICEHNVVFFPTISLVIIEKISFS